MRGRRKAWALRAETATLGERSEEKGSWSARAKSERLLKQEEGVFIIQPASRGASNARIAAADAEAGLLNDPMAPVAWKLYKASLAASAGKPETYGRIGKIRRLAKLRKGAPLLERSKPKRGRKSRGKKQRRE